MAGHFDWPWHGVYLTLRSNSTSARTAEISEGDADEIASVESPEMEMGSDGEPEPEGDSDGEPPVFSPEAMVQWMYRRCTRREEQAAQNNNMAKAVNYHQKKNLLQEMLTFLHHANEEE